MPYLIDGHNLIGQTPGLSLADPDDERKLVVLLRTYLMRTRKKGTVFFDNGQPGGTGQWSNSVLEVVFVRPTRSADDLIRQRLSSEKNPRGLIVVSSDQAVVQAALAKHARVQGSSEFAQQMTSQPPATGEKRDGLVTKDEVLEWERLFKKGRG
jgi:predicted RNA-binding protein with PIN domain